MTGETANSLDARPFEEPWHAQAFAMVVHLEAQNAFTWPEWTEALAAEIHGPEQRDYYEHWLAALETLITAKGFTDRAALEATKSAWQKAAQRTPHGQPLRLER